MASNKRLSILPAVSQQGPKPPVKLSSSLTISDSAILAGTHSIVIMSETVVHPRCRLESMAGSLLIGKRGIVQERSQIGACPSAGEDNYKGGVTLGDYVTVEVGVVVEAGGTEIGEGTTLGVGVRVGSGARIGKVRRAWYLRV
jgi:dynactin 6